MKGESQQTTVSGRAWYAVKHPEDRTESALCRYCGTDIGRFDGRWVALEGQSPNLAHCYYGQNGVSVSHEPETEGMQSGRAGNWRVVMLDPIGYDQLLQLTETWLGLHADLKAAPTLDEFAVALVTSDSAFGAYKRQSGRKGVAQR